MENGGMWQPPQLLFEPWSTAASAAGILSPSAFPRRHIQHRRIPRCVGARGVFKLAEDRLDIWRYRVAQQGKLFGDIHHAHALACEVRARVATRRVGASEVAERKAELASSGRLHSLLRVAFESICSLTTPVRTRG